MSGHFDCHPGAMAVEATKQQHTPATSPSNTPPQALTPHDSPMLEPTFEPTMPEAHQVMSQQMQRRRVCSVGDTASRAPMIYGGSTLTDVCDTLEFSGHSSAVMIGDDGTVQGILTENDILKAYSDEAPWQYDVDLWLQSGEARIPGWLLPVLTIKGSMPLVEAAAKMAVQRLGDFACHHLLLSGGALGRFHILSALDIAMALCNGDLGPDAIGQGVTVADVMKDREHVAECKGTDTIKGAFDTLLNSAQNCALVVEQHGGFVYGTITPRDAMRAFVEHVPEGTAVAGWLRGVGTSPDPRRVDANTPIVDAAQVMVSNSWHHLLVVEPGTVKVIGVVSCLDIVSLIGARRLGETPEQLQEVWAQ